MSYDEIPRPEVEGHYHIRELIEAQEKRSDDRQYHRDKAKEKAERDDLIKEAKLVTVTDFWCNTCNEDFKSMSVKEVEEDWSASQRIAFYKAKCAQGHWCIRLITDKHKDGFWMKSRNIIRDRGVFYADTLQPWETNFNLIYGKKN